MMNTWGRKKQPVTTRLKAGRRSVKLEYKVRQPQHGYQPVKKKGAGPFCKRGGTGDSDASPDGDSR